MSCESGGNPNAVGDTHLTYQRDNTTYGYSVGLMQIRYLPGRPEKAWLLEPDNNIRYAAQMWQRQDWNPWTCKKVL